jgi:DNA-binding MarR family transcriptional regulator
VDLLVAIREAAIGRGHRRSLWDVTGFDLPGTERWVLHAVPGDFFVPLAHVARSVGSPLPVVSRACANLADRGMLVRLPDPRDRRRMLIGLTDETVDALASWAEAWPSRYVQAVEDWPVEHVHSLDEWLRLVAASLADQLSSSVSPRRRHSLRPATDSGLPSHLRHFRSTIELLVPVAGRLDLQSSVKPRLAAPIQTALLHLLLAVRAQPATAAELSVANDIDASLVRRRLDALIGLRLVSAEKREAAGGRQTVFSPSDEGREVASQFLADLASALPDVPDRLVSDGLAPLIADFTATLVGGSGYSS